MLGYFGHIITLCAAIIALFGDTWNKKEKGFHRLTLTGRLAVGIALIGFTFSSIETYKQQKRIYQLHQVAASEVQRHWKALIYPFTMILWAIDGHSY
ncbi:hypothetical protein [Candidatus Manganitrophus noduliformans]|uniref:Uncharacterized protein n=1 Tax=Candidatus Manganitrophus noduliformans TaxID=2606439 RepID=A0A7X6IB11_9BACT|nr:hypothetical protein [Candidatus Manganitrophus noduliformans]NKE71291.1 hypothetical protein [Candidatus Manganitrophus noduliformans]